MRSTDFQLIALHSPIWRWRWAEGMAQGANYNPWRYIDPHNQDQAWPARKAQLEGMISLEPVTSVLMREVFDEEYEEGRSDEKFGCERGERKWLIEKAETAWQLAEWKSGEATQP